MVAEILPDVGEYDEEKFSELLMYISEQCSTDPNFGAVKLNKILHASDFLAYALFGKPITGAEYFHLPNGPAPKYLRVVREELAKQGHLVVQERTRFNFRQTRTVPLREANLSRFTAEEIALVGQVIKAFEGQNATDLSRLSHINNMSIGWQLTRDRETIPYQTVFVSAAPPSQDDLTWARELAERDGWLQA